MTKEQIVEIFREAGVIREGHFLLTSGRHSDRYMQCAHLFERPWDATALTGLLAKELSTEKIDLVLSPAVGGILLGYELARQLGVRNIFAERENGTMVLRRGFSIRRGERIAVTEDVVTTGGTVREILDLARMSGGVPVVVGAVVDRSAGKVNFGVPLRATISMEMISWDAETCPLCASGSRAVKPGSRGLA